jgi:hypothetical protein
MLLKKITGILCFITPALLSLPVNADGLTDLKRALAQLKEPTPFKAQVIAEVKNTNIEDNEQINKEGNTRFHIEQTDAGLEIHYDNTLLQQIDAETQAKQKNPAAKTPATEAMNQFNYSELSTLLYPLRDIERDLEKAIFKYEEQTTFEGKPARLIHLSIPLKNLSKEESKNLKKYKTTVDIWVDENGTPLASHSKGTGSGRVALVIGFEFHFDVRKTYAKIGNRLITTHLALTSGSSGAGMSGKEAINATLTLLDNTNP